MSMTASNRPRGTSPRTGFWAWLGIVLGVGFCLSACARVSPRPAPPRSEGTLQKLAPEACEALLSGEDDAGSVRAAAEQSVAALARRQPEQSLPLIHRSIRASAVRRAADVILQETHRHPSDWTHRICRRLTLHRVTLPTPVLVTGYYQPIVPARRRRDGRFRYPVYGAPATPVRYTRAQIDAGALDGEAPVLAWFDDPVELFFLQIQGSGVLDLEDGGRLQIGFAGSNGRPYRGIGAAMVEQGKLKPGTASMQAIKDYFRAHPAERDAILHLNERYVFFRINPTGPIGSLGAPLTAGRSIAADAQVYPPGAPAFLAARTPGGRHLDSRLVFIQDTGSAITGAAHVDLFFGTGDEAGRLAGRTREDGDLYLFLE